jgi:hypothetical protein
MLENSAFLLTGSCFSPALAFWHQGSIWYCWSRISPALPSYGYQFLFNSILSKKSASFQDLNRNNFLACIIYVAAESATWQYFPWRLRGCTGRSGAALTVLPTLHTHRDFTIFTYKKEKLLFFLKLFTNTSMAQHC